MDTTGYGNPVETQNTSSSQKNKTKKAIHKKDKESKKNKKQKRLLENLIWIGTHDLMQDNVTMTERQDGSVPNQILK